MEMAIEHVRDRPAYLKSLDVEAFAKSKERVNKIQTFYDIRRELVHGFQDWRKKYEELSQDEEFYMLSGEPEDTVAEGRIVQARACRKVERKDDQGDEVVAGLLTFSMKTSH